MDRRRILSDVPEPQLFVELRSPLIDPKKLRSCRGLSRSASVSDSGTIHKRASSTIKSNSLKPISELGQQLQQPLNSKYYALNRSQSAPHYLRSPHYTTPGAQHHLRSPQYRVNPVVKFDDRALPPQRMNYGIAGYNTSRPRPHSFSSIPETAIASTRPRSFTTIPESPRPKPRPRSFSSVPESRPRSLISRSVQTPRPAVRAVVWRSWTRRFRDKMGRIRVRDTCSKLLSRFRG